MNITIRADIDGKEAPVFKMLENGDALLVAPDLERLTATPENTAEWDEAIHKAAIFGRILKGE